MNITLDTEINIAPDVYFQNIGGEAVLLDLKSGKYFGLDEIGSHMWQLLNEYKNLRKVYTTLTDEYEVEPARLETDLLNLVTVFIEKELMVASTSIQ
jgi:hypothetical protein